MKNKEKILEELFNEAKNQSPLATVEDARSLLRRGADAYYSNKPNTEPIIGVNPMNIIIATIAAALITVASYDAIDRGGDDRRDEVLIENIDTTQSIENNDSKTIKKPLINENNTPAPQTENFESEPNEFDKPSTADVKSVRLINLDEKRLQALGLKAGENDGRPSVKYWSVWSEKPKLLEVVYQGGVVERVVDEDFETMPKPQISPRLVTDFKGGRRVAVFDDDEDRVMTKYTRSSRVIDSPDGKTKTKLSTQIEVSEKVNSDDGDKDKRITLRLQADSLDGAPSDQIDGDAEFMFDIMVNTDGEGEDVEKRIFISADGSSDSANSRPSNMMIVKNRAASTIIIDGDTILGDNFNPFDKESMEEMKNKLQILKDSLKLNLQNVYKPELDTMMKYKMGGLEEMRERLKNQLRDIFKKRNMSDSLLDKIDEKLDKINFESSFNVDLDGDVDEQVEATVETEKIYDELFRKVTKYKIQISEDQERELEWVGKKLARDVVVFDDQNKHTFIIADVDSGDMEEIIESKPDKLKNPVIRNKKIIIANGGNIEYKTVEKMRKIENDVDKFIKINKLIPVVVPTGKADENGETVSFIFWYDPKPEFLEILPAEEREELKRELNILEESEEICEAAAIAGEDAYLDIWRSCSGSIDRFSVYPNPATTKLNVKYALGDGGKVTIALHDLFGAGVRELAAQNQAAGEHSLSFNIDGIAPGIYLVVVQTQSGEQAVQRVIVE